MSTQQSFNQELHISHSQIFTYLNCSLKYKFQYIEGKKMERISIALPFGGAIHSAIEMYYRSMKNNGSTESLGALSERFETCLELDLENSEVPVIFKKELPNHDGAVKMGNAMLKVFLETIPQTLQNVQEIIGVELPLTAKLYNPEDSQPTEFKLAGILDLVIRDKNGYVIVIDNKTAAKPMAQTTADDDMQMSSYAYLICGNKFVLPTSQVQCRFDILRKLVTPKMEHVLTSRTSDQRKRFAKIACSVLSAIDAKIHIPQTSWMCVDCGFASACKTWHLQS